MEMWVFTISGLRVYKYLLFVGPILIVLGATIASAETTKVYFFHETKGYAISSKYGIGAGNKLLTPVLSRKEYCIVSLQSGIREIWVGESNWGGGRVDPIVLRPNSTQYFVYGAKRRPTVLRPLGGHVYIQEISRSKARDMLKTFKLAR